QFHRARDIVGVEDDLAVEIARGTTGGLDQRAFRAQKALLVRIEYGDQRDLGNVQPFAQQVDADQHIEFPEAQVAYDFHALHGVDVRVQIAYLDAVFGEIVGEVF